MTKIFKPSDKKLLTYVLTEAKETEAWSRCFYACEQSRRFCRSALRLIFVTSAKCSVPALRPIAPVSTLIFAPPISFFLSPDHCSSPFQPMFSQLHCSYALFLCHPDGKLYRACIELLREITHTLVYDVFQHPRLYRT